MALLHSIRSALAVAFRRRRFEDGVPRSSGSMSMPIPRTWCEAAFRSRPRARRARIELGSTEALKEELRAARGQRLLRRTATGHPLRGAQAATRARSGRRCRACARHRRQPRRVQRHSRVAAAAAATSGPRSPCRDLVAQSRERSRASDGAARLLRLREAAVRPSPHAAYYPPGFTLTGGEQAERVSGARASSGIFEVFGVQPVARPGVPAG